MSNYRVPERINHEYKLFPVEGLILHEGVYYVVATQHGVLRALRCEYIETHQGKKYGHPPTSHPGRLAIIYPIHSSVTLADIGRHYWDDGDAWHISHCSPKEQIDLAATIEQFTFNEFLESIAFENTRAAQATSNIVRGTATTKAFALIEFARAAGRAAHAKIVGMPLGHFHRDIETDHKREQAIAAINKVFAEWLADSDKDVDRGYVNDDVNKIKARLSSTHTIQTWPEAREADRPKIKAQIGTLTQVVGGVATSLSMAQYFMDDDPLTFTAESDDTDVATVAIVTTGPTAPNAVVTPGTMAGTATIKIVGTDPGKRTVEQSFMVKVVAAQE